MQVNSNTHQEVPFFSFDNFEKKISKINSKVESFAKKIIKTGNLPTFLASGHISSDSSNKANEYHHYHHDTSLFGPSYLPYRAQPATTINNYNGSTVNGSNSSSTTSSKEKKDSSDSAAFAMVAILGVTFLVIGGIGCYCLGQVNTNNDEINSELEAVEKLDRKVKKLENNKELPENSKAIVEKAQKVVALNKKICYRIQSSLNWDFYNNAAMMLGTGMAFAGALQQYVLPFVDNSLTSVMLGAAPGAIVLTGSLFSMLYKAGSDNTSQLNINDANKITVKKNKIDTSLKEMAEQITASNIWGFFPS